MKKMKFLLVFILFLSMSFYGESMSWFKGDYNGGANKGKGRHNGGGQWHHGGGHGNPVGAPLDGGLLSILGVAGVTYYLVRRNKKKQGV